MKPQYISERLRPVLITTVIVANIFVAGLLAYLLSDSKDRRESEARMAAENVALLLDVSVTEVVGKIDLSLRATLDDLEGVLLRRGQLSGQNVNASLARRQKWFTEFAVTFRVINASGVAEYCNGCELSTQENFATNSLFVKHREQPGSGLIVGGVSLDQRSGNWSLSFSRRYTFSDGRFAGVIVATVPTTAFGQILSKINLGPSGTVALRDANLALIDRFPELADASRRTGSQIYSNEYAAAVASGNMAQTYHTLQSGEGLERTIAYRRLAQVPFHVAAGMATQDYLSEWRNQVIKATLVAVLFLLSSTILAGLLWRASQAADVTDEVLRLLMLNASDGIHILDDQRNVVEVSDAFCNMLGYTRAEMIGMNVTEWDMKYSPGQAVVFDERVADLSQVATFEASHRRKDGSGFDVEITARPVEFGGRQVVFCSARDITERKKAVQALIESEAKFRKFFEENGSVMLIVEPDQGVISAANRAATVYYGFASDELVGMNINQINAVPDADLASPRRRALQKERHLFDDRHRLASGEERDVEIYAGPVDIDGSPMLFCIVHDVSQRKAVEAKNQRLSNLYATLSQCNQAIVHCVNETELFQKVCASVVEYGFVKMAWIGLVDEAKEKVNPVAWYGGELNREYITNIPMTLDESERQGRGLTSTAIRNNQPQWSQDYLNDPITSPWHEHGRKAGWRSAAALPLCCGGIPVGGLVIYSDTVNAFNEDVRDLLSEMAMTISFALDNFAREAARQRSVEALQASENRYRLVFQTSLDAISINRFRDATYVDVNDGFVKTSGFQREDVIGNTAVSLDIWVDLEDRQHLTDRLKQELSCRNVEARFRRKNGEVFWGLMSASLAELDGETCILAITRDISDIKLAESEIKKLAFYDPLTQLANRRLLTDRLNQAVLAASYGKKNCALLFVDLDNFKMLNDSSGHAMGDLLLQEVSKRLKASLRGTDTVARFGGDEFVVLLENLSESLEEAQTQAQQVAQDILAAIRRPYLLANRECRSAASIGITMFGWRKESSDTLLMQADIAMYQAKATGRNTLRFFSPELQAAINSRAGMEEDLHRAVALGQFLLYYQPQVDQGDIVGAEVLVRWSHPKQGLVSPAKFIPQAEECGLILPLGQWVLETACRQLATWAEHEDTADLVLAVNVSALQFQQTNFVEQTLLSLKRTGARPQRLKLEIVESMLMDDIESVIEKMTVLRTHGVRFSLDDFGTGYSSLSYLKRLPLDQLKIDWSFVRDVLTNANDAAIAQTIVALGQAMGLSVIAEGVETEAQKVFLASIGCHAYQGFLFGRPMPLEEFQELLTV